MKHWFVRHRTPEKLEQESLRGGKQIEISSFTNPVSSHTQGIPAPAEQ